MKRKIHLVIIMLAMIYSHSYLSQSIYGGEIKVQNLGGLNYKAKVYISLSSSINYTLKPFVLLDWGDGTSLDTLPYQSTQCGTFALSHEYSKNHLYPAYGNYSITCSDGSLVSGISNLPNSSSKTLELRYDLFAQTLFTNNTSPNFASCISEDISLSSNLYNLSATDIDGDSMFFQSYFPTNYIGFTAPNFSINNTNSLLTYTGSTIGVFLVPVLISEYRKISNIDYLIGKSYRVHSLTISTLSSIAEPNFNKYFTIHPNPTNSILNIIDENNQFQNTIIQIKNPLGQVVFTTPFTSQINLSNLSTGIYFLTIQNGTIIKTAKIIKQ